MPGLIGKKIGMTQLFADDGTVVPVTAIEAGPCPIVQVKTEERDGYRAVQLGFGQKKERRSNKPQLGHAAGAGLDYAPAITREFRLGRMDDLAEDPHVPGTVAAPEPVDEAPTEEAEAAGTTDDEGDDSVPAEPEAQSESGDRDEEEGLRVGERLTVSIFAPGERVKVTGRSKGRGFQGVVKRHGFAGRPKSHGHPSIRVPGSIGAGTDPSRVIKGRKMAGRMGGDRQTIRNLEVVRVDAERNLLFIKGSVPGARNSWVFISKQ